MDFTNKQNIEFDNTFLKMLEERFPEKFLILQGFHYFVGELRLYISNINLTVETFNPLKFKKITLYSKNLCQEIIVEYEII